MIKLFTRQAATKVTAAAVACGLVATGCSSHMPAPTAVTTASPSTYETTGTATDTTKAATPTTTVRINTALGPVDAPSKPAKVAAIGSLAADNLIALGIIPQVVVVAPFEKHVPWHDDYLHDSTIIVATNPRSFPFEKLADTHPNLIVGDAWHVTKSTFARYSSIAPTIGAVGTGVEQRSWKPQLEALGEIYGRQDAARRVIARDAKLFATARKAMPGLAGKTGVLCKYDAHAHAFTVVSDPKAPANEFVTDLGMKVVPAVTRLPAGPRAGRSVISEENIDKLNGDYLAVYPVGDSRRSLEKLTGFDELRQSKTGAITIGSNTFMMALNVPSALSRAWALEQVRPQLEKALSYQD